MLPMSCTITALSTGEAVCSTFCNAATPVNDAAAIEAPTNPATKVGRRWLIMLKILSKKDKRRYLGDRDA